MKYSIFAKKNKKVENEIKKALEVLKKGGVILYPTDTVWGIGCDATNEEAIKKVYTIKNRPDTKSMLVLIDSEDKLDRYVSEVPAVAYDLIELSEKPLTIIYSGAKNLPKNLVPEDFSIGIRVTKELFSKTLCERLRRPLVSTSANISGEKTPTTFAQISQEILDAVDYVVDFNRNSKEAQPSSIIKLGAHGEVQIIRE